jgi:HlyD family secretion protein
MIKKFINTLIGHKLIAGSVIVVLAAGGYFGYRALNNNTNVTRYILTAVRKGVLTTTVSGSGQVATSDSVDLKPQASGNIVYVGVVEGQTVKAGQLIAQLDTTDAQKAVRDAQLSLDSENISFETLMQPASTSTLLQSQQSVLQAQQSLRDNQNSLVSDYATAYTDISNSYIALPGVMTGLNNILYSMTINKSQNNVDAYTNLINNLPSASRFNHDAVNSYQTALAAYTQALADFKNSNINSSTSTVESLLTETNSILKAISVANSNIKNLLDLVSNTLQQSNLKAPGQLNTDESSMPSYISTVNNQLSTILNIQNSIQNDKQAIINANNNILQTTASLEELKNGPTALQIQSEQLSLTQKKNALLDAQENLANYYVRAPFDGTISKVYVQKGDPASSGTAVATLITKQRIAQLSLNEIDAAKVQVGQAAALTFDAVPGLTIDGQVSEVDTVGTVSQGVVTYGVQISFNTQDVRVKPGMTVTALIVTENKPDVLLIPNASIKTLGNRSYVLMPAQTDLIELSATSSPAGVVLKDTPIQKIVQVGSSNGAFTEVLSGLNEGDKIISRTITTSGAATATTQTQSSASLLRGLTGGVGGFRAETGGTSNASAAKTTTQTTATSH